ncbi:MAG: cell division protein FtsA [Rikenellaceae bacterium]
MSSNYTIAIDLGQNSVVAVAGTKDENGTFHVAATAERVVRGVMSGRIENIAQVNDALSGVIAELEEQLNVKIEQAYGGISGEYVRCVHHTERVTVSEPNSGVTSNDVVSLHSKIMAVEAPQSDTIMESMPQNYLVDNRVEVKNPVGTFGNTLSSLFNFVLCEKEALKRLHLAFSQAGITLKRCYANSVVAAEAVLTKDEKEGGVAVVDLGEGMTNVAIYYNGALRAVASIPLGGAAINHDIRSLMIQERSIESIKCEHGTAIAEHNDHSTIQVAGRTPRSTMTIPTYNLSVAIQERVIDIIKYVYREIRDSGYDGRLIYGIVLTGGGAKLDRVDELFAAQLGQDVRIAMPDDHIDESSFVKVASPSFATAVGILKRGADMDMRGVGKPCTVSVEPAEDPEKVERERAEAAAAEESARQLDLNLESEGGADGAKGDEAKGDGASFIDRAKNFMNTKVFGSLFHTDEGDDGDDSFA